jgi:transketolase
MKKKKEGMREVFFKELFKLAKKDKKIMLLSADIGAQCHDDFRKKLKGQYVNAGVAEQNMIGVASGLAMAGKIVYVYSIAPFVTMRCYEQIRVDLCGMNLPVVIVSIGAGLDYSTLGFTHHGTEDLTLMKALPGMAVYSPCDNTMAKMLVKETYKGKTPQYVRLDRTGLPLVYQKQKNIDFKQGFSHLKRGKDLYIISTGRMLINALGAAKKLPLDCGVIDLFRVKPFNKNNLEIILKRVKHVVSLEEHFTDGGIGSLISGLLAGLKDGPLFKPIGLNNQFCRSYGSRRYLQNIYGLDAESVAKSILGWISNNG